MVGTSGSRSERFSLVTAIAFSLPPLIRPMTVGVLNRPIVTSPLATALDAGGRRAIGHVLQLHADVRISSSTPDM